MKENEALRNEQLNLHRQIEELKLELKQQKESIQKCRDEFFKSIIQIEDKHHPENIKEIQKRLIQKHLCSAVIHNNFYKLKLILEYLKENQIKLDSTSCCENHEDNYHSCNILALAAIKNKIDIFNYLCTNEFENFDCTGNNILLLLSELHNEYYAFKLIEIGAQICLNKKNDSITCLYQIISSKSTKLIAKLIEAGLNINIFDKDKTTALYWTCYSGNLEHTALLLYYGSDILVRDNIRTTAFDIAVEFQHFDIANLIFDYVFHENESNSIDFKTLLRIFRYNNNSELYEKLKACDFVITYNKITSEYYYDLESIDSKYFAFILKRCSQFVVELIENSADTSYAMFNLKLDILRMNHVNQIQNFCLLVQSDYITQIIDASYDVSFKVIKNVICYFKRFALSLELLHEIVMILLSYGVVIYGEEVIVLYENYGCCPLFLDIINNQYNNHSNAAVEKLPTLLELAKSSIMKNC